VVVVAVVVAVSVELCADVLLLKDSEVEERPHVAALVAPVGAVTAQLSVTVPVNELPGVTPITEVPLPAAPALMVMLPLLERLKPVVLLLSGACQKSPQPARSVAAANNPTQRPIFIAAPFAPSSGYTRNRSPTLF
jgi:hypothetical protein